MVKLTGLKQASTFILANCGVTKAPSSVIIFSFCRNCFTQLFIFFVPLVLLEVYATREKNGVYIPKERYYQEENERKVAHLCFYPHFVLFSVYE